MRFRKRFFFAWRIAAMTALPSIERSDRWTPSGRRRDPRGVARRPSTGFSTIHPMNCSCSDCVLISRRDRARIRAWVILFIGLAGALYGTVFANAAQIAASFGFHL
jgi:hypothetical protein